MAGGASPSTKMVFPPLPTRPQDNNIVRNLRGQEIGKLLLTVSITATVAFSIYFFNQKSGPAPVLVQLVAVLMCISCTAILYGILLRDDFPVTAILMEFIGIAIVLLAFHGIVGSLLPPELWWIIGMIGGFTVAPFIASTISIMRMT